LKQFAVEIPPPRCQQSRHRITSKVEPDDTIG
jgi:hypothetical protein